MPAHTIPLAKEIDRVPSATVPLDHAQEQRFQRLMDPLIMVDVHLPTTDGRELVLSRYTQPDAGQQLVLEKLNLTLPTQPPPRIHSRQLLSSASPAQSSLW